LGVALIGAVAFFFIRKRRANSNDREVFNPDNDSEEYGRPSDQNNAHNAEGYPPMAGVAPPPPRHTYYADHSEYQ
jgi:hypothetical protein